MRQANIEELDMVGRKINNLRYADDTTLLTERKERRTVTAGNECKGEECPGRTLLKPEVDKGHVY